MTLEYIDAREKTPPGWRVVDYLIHTDQLVIAPRPWAIPMGLVFRTRRTWRWLLSARFHARAWWSNRPYR